VERRSSDNISTQASKHHKILRKAYTTCSLDLGEVLRRIVEERKKEVAWDLERRRRKILKENLERERTIDNE
jgi:hypothetical protein